MYVKIFKHLALSIGTIVFISCSSPSGNVTDKSDAGNEEKTYSDDKDSDPESDSEYREESESTGDCVFDDGSYSANVDYYNPDTGYSQTYTLNVEVEDCQVVQIDFPNGGWLDGDHIDAADIDEDGNANIESEDGRTFSVHIDQ